MNSIDFKHFADVYLKSIDFISSCISKYLEYIIFGLFAFRKFEAKIPFDSFSELTIYDSHSS